MCNLFSFRSDGAGKFYYLNAEQRKKVLANGDNPDSHTYIAEYYGFKGKDEDMLNAYEYNPITKEFLIDRMPNKDDSKLAKEWVEALDFKTIVPKLIIKPIINPLLIERSKDVTEYEIGLLKEWIKVRYSVRYSVWASVRAYMSSFFDIPKWQGIDHEKGKNPFQSAIDLWEAGLVPSFDGKIWRLHTGKDAKIVYEIKEKEE